MIAGILAIDGGSIPIRPTDAYIILETDHSNSFPPHSETNRSRPLVESAPRKHPAVGARSYTGMHAEGL
jgi:hypothetical protein